MASTTALQSATYSTPETTYNGFTDLVKQIRSTSGDIIIINNVSLANLNHISSEREKRGLGFRLSLYMADTGQLIITIPTKCHEILHLFLNQLIIYIITIMGIPEDLVSVGATTFHNLVLGGCETLGEGDSCLQPRVCLPNGFPTVVIQAGHTQPLASLQNKAKWWFSVSHFDVKIVILAKFEQSKDRIIIEKWKAVARPGVGTQAQANGPQLEPKKIQEIYITRYAPENDPADPASYNVTAPLHLEFIDVFLREPIEGQGDIVIDIPKLQSYAVQIFWLTNGQ